MSNPEKLETYLIEKKKGYLFRDISNSKVMMLSGKWGSGKTHFWKEKIAKKIEKNIYISLYGKTSIKDIEYEVLAKAYYRSLGKEDGEQDAIEKLFSTFSSLSGAVDAFSGMNISSLLNFAKDKSQDSKNKKAEKLIDNGLVICFDDFERKSSTVDLQDLFGFVTNLALQYEAKIVIILNDDVFKGEDQTVFSNVKEKSVSKYLSFSPTSGELFEIIFDIYGKSLEEHKEVLKNTFEEVNIVNARILIQILDNVSEWIRAGEFKNDETLRLVSLVNINFILHHCVFEAIMEKIDENRVEKIINVVSLGNNASPSHTPKYIDKAFCSIKGADVLPDNIGEYIQNIEYGKNMIELLKYRIKTEEKKNGTKSGKPDNSQALLDYVDSNKLLIQSLLFMKYYNIEAYCSTNSQVEVETFNKVNTFIETGIL